MVCYGCFAFFLLLGGLLVTLVGYYPLDMDHSSGAAPRPQRALCALKFLGPSFPFVLQPHLHAAVTLQQSVAHSAKGRRGGEGVSLAGLRMGRVARRGAHPHAGGPCCTWCSGTARLPCAPATRRGGRA